MKRLSLMLLALCLAAALARGAEEPLPKFLNSEQIQKIPAQPAGQPDDFRFIVMGDTRDGDPMFEYMLSLAQSMGPLFIINVGDLVHSGLHDQYLHYYDQIKDMVTPYVSVIGNHETHAPGGIDRYVQMLGPTDGSFDIGDSRFIYFDNCGRNGYTLTDAQFVWLEELLKTDKKKFIFMHAPPSFHVWDHGMDKPSTEKFVALMDKYEVQRVYFGHVHAYDRFVRNKTTYVMTGCAGAEPDPLGERFIHPLGGGFYHLDIAEVRGDKIMDVLVIPDSADILEFPSPKSNMPLELAYAGYRHFNTPLMDAPETGGGRVKVRIRTNPLALAAGLSGVTLSCTDKSGKALNPVALDGDVYDEQLWSAALPADAAACALDALDPARARTVLLPSLGDMNPSHGGDMAPENIPFHTVAADLDDPSQSTLDDLDIRNLDFAYDDDYFYFRMNVDGEFSEGVKDPANRKINIYGFLLLNDTLEIEPDIEKMLGAAPLLAYAPLAATLGMPKCGIIDATGFRRGKFSSKAKGVKCVAQGDTLFVRAERNLFGDKADLMGFKLLAAAIQLLTQPILDVNIGDVSDPAHILLHGVKP